jgi:hypothetical protein
MKKGAILTLLALLALPAIAAEKEDAKKGGKPGTNVDMPFLMAPMTNADGKLSGYAYLSSRLTATSDANALVVREKLPFIQDVMVRDINTTGVTGADPEQVDIPAVEQRLLADAAKVLGAGKVKLIIICTVQVASLHPVQTPAKVTPTAMPGAPAPKNPEKSRCES